MSNSPNKDNKNKDFNKFNPFGDFNKQGSGKNQNNFARNMLIWMLLAAGLFSVYVITQAAPKADWPITFTEYKNLL